MFYRLTFRTAQAHFRGKCGHVSFKSLRGGGGGGWPIIGVMKTKIYCLPRVTQEKCHNIEKVML